MPRSSRKSHSVSGKTVVPANTAPPTATRALPSRVAARQIPDPDMGINRLHAAVSLPPKRGSPLPARVEEDRCTRAGHTRRPAGFPETLTPVSAARPLGRSRRQAGFRGPSPTPGGSHWAGRPDPLDTVVVGGSGIARFPPRGSARHRQDATLRVPVQVTRERASMVWNGPDNFRPSAPAS